VAVAVEVELLAVREARAAAAMVRRAMGLLGQLILAVEAVAATTAMVVLEAVVL